MINTTTQGKIPPQAIELEEAVLGALLIEEGAHNEVMDVLIPLSFYYDPHKDIFTAILELVKENNKVDILTVVEKLKRLEKLEDVGGAYYITQLTSRVASASNIEYHARIVAEKYMQRELIRISGEMNDSCYQGIDVFDTADLAVNQIQKVTELRADNLRHIEKITEDVYKIIRQNSLNDGMSGVPSGFCYYDKFSNGFQGTDLIVIAGEPSNGKTSLALNVARRTAVYYNTKVGIWSGEMSDTQLATRLISNQSQVGAKEIMTGKLSRNEMDLINEKINPLIKSNIYIDDGAFEINYLERSIIKAKNNLGIQLVVIDYLQLITNNDRLSTYEKLGVNSRRLKNLARKLKIPIILLSQLNREKGNPKPTLSRLRGSGEIAEAADVVWFVHYPFKYDIYEIEYNNISYPSEGLIMCDIAKGRNIGLTRFLLKFTEKLTLFEDFIPADF